MRIDQEDAFKASKTQIISKEFLKVVSKDAATPYFLLASATDKE
jgi:hypothetical protein